MKNTMEIDQAVVAEHLDRALDAVLAVRVMISGEIPTDLPDEALDAALQADEDYQSAREEFATVLEALMEAVWGDAQKRAVLALEGTVNSLVWQAAAMGWCLRMRATGGDSGPGREFTGQTEE